MVAALVNADYEFELYREELGASPPERTARNRDGLEFIFFFINQDPHLPLLSQVDYPSDYLASLAALGVTLPTLVRHGASFNWYGKLTDREKEKKLNSKLWGYELLNRLGLNPTANFVVQDAAQVHAIMRRHPTQKWLLKSPYLMSGMGFHTLTGEADVTALGHPHILEPYLERLIDTALFHDPLSGETFFYVNRANAQGGYLGGMVFQHPEGFRQHLAEQGWGACGERLEKQGLALLAALKLEGLEQPLSIDSFLFQTSEGAKAHPGCDINYRQNMGSLLNHLRRFLPAGGVGDFLLLNRIEGLPHGRLMPYSLEERAGVIYLSSPAGQMLGLFFAAPSVAALKKMQLVFFQAAGVRP